ncbi:MAG TPA: polyphosphate kinase 1 [Bryobacteraceae bacterium]|jgi:polyphosphate kinase
MNKKRGFRVTAKAAVAPAIDLYDPSLLISRELSLLEFQRRVLAEAADPANKLLERIKFLSIFSSNIDEFFMVRVAGIMQQVEQGVVELSHDGKTPHQQLTAIGEVARALVADAYSLYREQLLPELSAEGIHIIDYSDLNDEQTAAADDYFHRLVFPVLTPLASDPGRPFPHISNLSLSLAVLIDDGEERFARVKVPDTLSQLVELPSIKKRRGASSHTFVWLEQIIAANLQYLFPDLQIVDSHPFHITRDADVAIQEIESDDLLETIEEAVSSRRFRDVVRLQVEARTPPRVIDILTSNLETGPEEVYTVKGVLDLGRLRQLLNLDRPDLKDKPFVPHVPQLLSPKSEEDIYSVIRREDVLLHHPYESFQPVVEFFRRAAKDPHVLAIKTTLYRTGKNSPIVEALLEAAENGKQVAVLVELKARFDEESNIEWARKLESEGVHVVYGLVGLKVHSKVALVVRQEGSEIRRYVHLATGNYNSATARLYTDLGLFTADEKIGADVTDLFNYLTGYSRKQDYRKLLVAPVTLRHRFEELIRREIDHQLHGRRGHLIFKMNALEDPPMIRLLYEASQAGVQTDLIVRGLSSIRPGIPDLSENIRVVSIVGRFLEHSRIYYFANGGDEEIYLSSADFMPRNLTRRVELAFPIASKAHQERLKQILEIYLSDTAKSWYQQPGGTYVRPAERNPKTEAQVKLLRRP